MAEKCKACGVTLPSDGICPLCDAGGTGAEPTACVECGHGAAEGCGCPPESQEDALRSRLAAAEAEALEWRDKALKHASDCGKAERDLHKAELIGEELCDCLDDLENENRNAGIYPHQCDMARAAVGKWRTKQ